MAGKTDEVDREALARFAWQRPDASEPPDALGSFDDLTEAELGALRLQIRKGAVDLARRVLEVQLLAPGSEERARAAGELVTHAAEHDLDLVGLAGEPESAKLVQLYLEAADRPDRATRKRFVLAVLHAGSFVARLCEWPEVFFDVVRRGDYDLVLVLEKGLEAELPARAAARLAAGLARLVREGTVGEQVCALQLLSALAHPSAQEALRGALSSPVLTIRLRALTALARVDGGLRGEELVRLVEDLEAHPLPRWRSDDGSDLYSEYETQLLAALWKVRPPGAEAPLRRLVSTRQPHFREGFEFAEVALALFAPGEALGRIDAALAESYLPMIRQALRKVAVLPEELAAPRLAAALGSPKFEVAAAACAIVEERGLSLPAGRTLGLLAPLLRRPPSAELATRLTLLEGPAEGAGALAVKLLAEAPDREALALLLRLAVGRDDVRREGLPRSSGEWAATLAARFGPEAVARGALLLGAHPHARDEVLSLLEALAEDGRLAGRRRREAYELALEMLPKPIGWVALGLVERLGLDPADWRHVYPLGFTREEDGDESDPLSRRARGVLRRLGRCDELNRAIREDLASPDAVDGRLADLGELAIARRLRSLWPTLVARFEAFEPGRDWFAYRRLGRALYAAGALDKRWIQGRLRHPERPLFGLAAWLEGPRFVPGATELLERTMKSQLREGRAAVEALWPLYATGHLRQRDRRAQALLARAPDETVAWFVRCVQHRGFQDVAAGPLLRLLTSDSPDAASAAVDHLMLAPEPRTRRLIDAALPRMRDPATIAWAKERLDRHPEDAYWTDEPPLAPSVLFDDEPAEAEAEAETKVAWYDEYDPDDDPFPPGW